MHRHLLFILLILSTFLTRPVLSSLHLPLHLSSKNPLLNRIANLTALTSLLENPPSYLDPKRLERKVEGNRVVYLGKDGVEGGGCEDGKGWWWGEVGWEGGEVGVCVGWGRGELVVFDGEGGEGGGGGGNSTTPIPIPNSDTKTETDNQCFLSKQGGIITAIVHSHNEHQFNSHLLRTKNKQALKVPYVHCPLPSPAKKAYGILGLAPPAFSRYGTSLLGNLPKTLTMNRITFSLLTPEKALLTLGHSPIPEELRKGYVEEQEARWMVKFPTQPLDSPPARFAIDRPRLRPQIIKTGNAPVGAPPTISGVSMGVGRAKHLFRQLVITVDPTLQAILMSRKAAERFYASYPGAHLLSTLNITETVQSLALLGSKIHGIDYYAVPCLNPAPFILEIDGISWEIEGRGGKVHIDSGFCLGVVIGVGWVPEGRGVLGMAGLVGREISFGWKSGEREEGGGKVEWVGLRDVRG